MGRLLFNSTFMSVLVSAGKIVLSMLAAIAFTYFGEFRGKPFFFILILITHMLPLPIRIVPTFELMEDLGWINTYYALTIPFFASATGMLLFRQFYLTVPTDLCDAARMDGAGPMKFLWKILFPLSRTNMMALFMIEFIYMWNQYLWPLIVTNSNKMRVVQIGIKMLLAGEEQAAEWNVIMAGTIIAMIPPLIVLFLLQSSFVKGFAMRQEK
jgi:sn-glycerol 3-phosphate transport system permease protein